MMKKRGRLKQKRTVNRRASGKRERIKQVGKGFLFRLLLIATACANPEDGPGTVANPEHFHGLRSSTASAPAPLTVPSNALQAADLTGTTNADGSKVTPGGLEGMASVTADGEAGYRIPLWVPPGRAGIQPELALEYHSRAPNGLLGVGWTLSGLHQISRCQHSFALDGDPGPVTFSTADSFCLDGERLILTKGTTYGASGTEYHTERDIFALITIVGTDSSGPTAFRIYQRDGRILDFANAVSGNRVAITTPTHITQSTGRPSWLLSQVSDRPGNLMKYSYLINAIPSSIEGTTGYEVIPQSITYTFVSGNTTVQALRSVVFHYTTRPDTQSRYVGGFKLVMTQRLASIEMDGPQPATPALLREYVFAYGDSTNGKASVTRQSLLLSAEECITDVNAAIVCKAPTVFTYATGNLSYTSYTTPIQVYGVECALTDFGCAATSYRAADINGDGNDDIVFWSYSVVGGTTEALTLETFTPTSFVGGPGIPLVLGTVQQVPTVSQPADNSKQFWVIDSNGDGRADLITTTAVSASTGVNFGSPVPLQITLDSVGDLNGDGLPDFLGFDPSSGLREYQLDLLGAPQPKVVIAPTFETIALFTPSLVADVAGAGKQASVGDGPLGYKQYVTVGTNGIQSGPDINLPNSPPSAQTMWFVDLNGDGLPDAISVGPSGGFPKYSFNTGAGFTAALSIATTPAASVWAIGPTEYDAPSTLAVASDPGVRIVDLDGDGREDVLVLGNLAGTNGGARTSAVVYLSTGDPNTPFVFQSLNIPLAGQGFETVQGYVLAQVLDINGDGLPDVAIADGSDVLHIYIRDGQKPDLLLGVTTGMGVNTAISYQPTNQTSGIAPSDGNCAYPLRCVNRGMWVVSQVVSTSGASDGVSPANRTVQYKYMNGLLDVGGRGWLGFEKRIVTDINAGITSTESYDLRTTVGPKGDPPYSYPHIGRPVAISTVYSNGSELGLTVTETLTLKDIITAGVSQSYYSTYIANEVHQEFEALTAGVPGTYSTTPTRSVTTTQTMTSLGNITQRDIYTGDNYHRSETYAYGQDNSSSGVWLIGRPTSTTIAETTPAQESVTRISSAHYDGYGSIDTETIEPSSTDSSLYLQITYARGDPLAAGLVTSITQQTKADSLNPAQTRTRTLWYDSSEHIFPIGVEDSLNPATAILYHPGLGALVVLKDPNGVERHYQVDLFTRPRGQWVQDSTGSVRSGSESNSFVAGASGGYGVTFTSPTGSGELDYDTLGRPFRTTHSRSDKTAQVNVLFNDLGAVVGRSSPFFTGSTPQYVTYKYDLRGRIRTINQLPAALGGTPSTITMLYSALKTFRFDEAGRLSCKSFDQAGNVLLEGDLPPNGTLTIQGCQASPAGGELRTTYTYSPFHLTKTKTSPLGVVSTFTYDVLGRQLASLYSTNFTTSAQYDAFGEVRTQTDPGGRYTETTHDTLGRPTLVTSAPNSTSAIDNSWTYNWDTALNGIGRIANALSPDDVQVTYGYDTLSRSNSETWTIQGAAHSVSRLFDPTSGLLSTVTYPAVTGGPSPLTVKYGFDAGGELLYVHDNATGSVFWSRNARNASGLITSETLGNGVTTTRQYDQQNHLRFINSSNLTSQQVQELAYEYSQDGNLTARHDLGAGTTEDFAYDGFDRLTTWTAHQRCITIPAAIQYSYDSDGNMISRQALSGPEVSTTYKYGYNSGLASVPAHAIASATTGGVTSIFSYDADGQQSSNGARTVAYKPFGLPGTIVQGTSMATFQYGPFGDRAYKSSPSGASIVYASGLYEIRNSGSQTVHVFKIAGESGIIAEQLWTVQNSAVTVSMEYIHKDRLGSPESITDQNGALIEHRKYEPFGERRSPTNLSVALVLTPTSDDEGFTGHGLDGEFDLIDMGGRVYDPHQAHFLTVDITAKSARVPSQRHNRFAYALNNPLRYTDPSGYGEETGDDGGGGTSAPPPNSTSAPAPSGNPDGMNFGPGNIDNGCGLGVQCSSVEFAPSDDGGLRPPDSLSLASPGLNPDFSPGIVLGPSGDANGTRDGNAVGQFTLGIVAVIAENMPAITIGVGIFAISMVSAPLAGVAIGGVFLYAALSGYNHGGWNGALDATIPIRPMQRASDEFDTAMADGNYRVAGQAVTRFTFNLVAVVGISAGARGLAAGAGAASAGEAEALSATGATPRTVLRRPYIRNWVEQAIWDAHPQWTPDGVPVDLNTGEAIVGKPHLGHKTGQEFWRLREDAMNRGLTQAEFNDLLNDPDLYQLEDPVSNMSHKYEKPR